MSEVLTRSLITGLSSVFLVTVLFIFGGTTLQDFAFAMMVGIASGTYSSIFIASPVLTHWKEREPAYRRRRERIEDQMGYVPPFPEENVISRLEGDDREAVPPQGPQAPEPAAPVQSAAPGVLGDSPAVAPPPAPPRPNVPVSPEPPASASPPPGVEEPAVPPTPEPPDGDGEGSGEGDGDGLGKHPELSEASAAALRRVQGGDRGGKRRGKRKHGRPR